jgi:TolB-like protein/Tfp pilus assembly protein PilF
MANGVRPMATSGPQIDVSTAEEYLNRVLASKVFERAQRGRMLLQYLVHAASATPPVAVKEYTIAIEVFDRNASYDPAVDATVRVEASRVRSRLREYYQEEGRGDPWQIELPKGGYTIHWRHCPQADPAAQEPVALPGSVHDELAQADGTPPGEETHRPAQRFWTFALTLAALCVLAAATAMFAVWRTRHPHAGIAHETLLAILPIANRTSDPTLSLVADGLTDDLIRQLSEVPALHLVARTTMFHYRGRSADAEAIAKTLRAETVMTGELKRSPEHLSLSVELSRSGDGQVLLDREYFADGDDLRTVQAELQHDVLSRLQVEGSARDPHAKLESVTASPQAYQQYLEAQALARNAGPAQLHQAIGQMEKAVALDPRFDLAWSALASEHLLLGLYYEPPMDHMPLARHFAERALAINPQSGEAHGSLGLIHLVYDWNLNAAAAEMNTAGAESAAIGNLACTSHLMMLSGRPGTAEEILGRMLTYDPESVALITEMGCINYYRGNYAAALQHFEEALKANPQAPEPYWGLGKTLNAEGRHAEAIAALSRFKERNGFEIPLLTAEIGYALGASGRRAEALAVVHKLTSRPQAAFVDPYLVSVVFASMKDRDAAFRWLDKAVEVRSAFVISVLTEPKWQPFRDDPRFSRLVEKLMRT